MARKGADPRHRKRIQENKELIATLLPTIIDPNTQTFLIYNLMLAGHSVGQIADRLGVSHESVSKLMINAQERINAEVDNMKLGLLSKNLLRLERIIQEMWKPLTPEALLPENLGKPTWTWDKNTMQILMQAIKLQKELFQEAAPTQNLNVQVNTFVPTLEYTSPLYGEAMRQVHGEQIVHHFPEDHAIEFAKSSDARIQRIEQALGIPDDDDSSD